MTADFMELVKRLGQYGGVEVTFFLLMLVYCHLRGYSDQACLEFATASVVIAGVSHAIPSPIATKEDKSIPPTTP